jgi:membrane peptidoglycan carboxypeptidase
MPWDREIAGTGPVSTIQSPPTGASSVEEHVPRPRERTAMLIWPGRMAGAPRIARWSMSGVTLALLLLATALTWAWQVTPSTAGLQAWVRAQDATHRTPYTHLAAVSPWMARALVATEDQHFYQHHGIGTLGLMRAAWDDLRAWNFSEGGSTLTAQLAKNAYLHGYDHTITLKLKDLLLAVKVENRYGKNQILEMYLNLVYYGEGAYGIGAAAQRYFGITPAHLDLAQAALLAGMVQAPGMYDPWCHPGLARARQHEVLDRMQDDGYITAVQARAAARETFSFWEPGASRPGDSYCAA